MIYTVGHSTRTIQEDLMTLARKHQVAMMCSEAVPWRCHRSMVADALLVHDFGVFDLLGVNALRLHDLASFAKVEGREITYPSLQDT